MGICIYVKNVMGSLVTTVKLEDELYTQFKEINLRKKLSLQDFVNLCLDKYVNDDKFRDEICASIPQKLSYDEPFQLSNVKK